ncbi:MAG: hypothetical protein FWD88_03755, partial [Treponema sp.]|nr:hypothetical protein [Treponema sp.]
MPSTSIADYKPSTPEELWAMMDRAAKRQEEFDRQQKESAHQREEDWKKIEKMFAESNRKIGGLDNTFGELIEHLVVPGVEERFKEIGILFEGIHPNSRIKEGGKLLAEVDLLLQNSESIMVVEVKSKPSTRDVETHRLRLEKLRGYYDRRG